MTTTHSPELNNGIWTSWLPVTTAWTSQAACNSAAWARVGIDPADDFWPYIYDPAFAQSVANSLICLPPEATQWWEGASTVSSTITSWSLAPLICPSAYATVSTIIVSETSTSIICCPTSFNFVRNLPQNSGIDGVCISAMMSGQSLTYASPASNSFAAASTTFTDSATLIAVPVEGYNFAASTTSSSSSTSPTASTSQSSSSGSASPTNSSAQKSGLSTGAEAGIGVGVGVLAIIAALAVYLFITRRRKYAPAPTELAGSGENNSNYVVEAGPGQGPQMAHRAEFDGNSKPVELPVYG